jgi:tRNA (guanine-N1)-methyltransferase
VLLSGDHKKIETFREQRAWEKTARNRPDLLNAHAECENTR